MGPPDERAVEGPADPAVAADPVVSDPPPAPTVEEVGTGEEPAEDRLEDVATDRDRVGCGLCDVGCDVRAVGVGVGCTMTPHSPTG